MTSHTPAALGDAASTPGSKRTALQVAKLHGANIKDKLFVITGAYSGIGVETVKALLEEKGKVVIGGRNAETQAKFTAQMKSAFPDGYIDGETTIDLGDLESVSKFAKYVDGKYDKIDCLILNAGVMNTPPGLTKDGFEMQMGTNVIGHFLLAKILAPKTTRQVWLSSVGHKLYGGGRIDIDYIKSFNPDTSSYNGWVAYQQSKLGDVLLAKEFSTRYAGMETASVHPGVIGNTGLSRHTSVCSSIMFLINLIPNLISGTSIVSKTPEVGASTTLTAAALPKDELEIGGYYDDCEPVGKMIEAATNEEDAKALFDYCDEVTKTFQ